MQATVAAYAGDDVFDDLEIAGLDGHVIQEDGAQDDPADGEEPVSSSHEGGGDGELGRHAEDQDGDAKRSGQSGQGSPVSHYMAEREKPEQNDNRKGCHESGQREAASYRGINLSPRKHLRPKLPDRIVR